MAEDKAEYVFIKEGIGMDVLSVDRVSSSMVCDKTACLTVSRRLIEL